VAGAFHEKDTEEESLASLWVRVAYVKEGKSVRLKAQYIISLISISFEGVR